MSLIKQLWIAIALVMTLAFGGSLVVSVLSARHYLEQQLQVKNIDNATSLAPRWRCRSPSSTKTR